MIRILFAMLMCSTAMGQSISVSGGKSSFIVSGTKPPEIVQVTSGDSEPVNLEKTDRETRFKFSSKMPVEPAKPQRRYLAMFTANYCGPCQTWKRNTKPQLEAAGYTVQIIELTDPVNQKKYGRRISRVPTFIVCDWDTGEWIGEPVSGGVDLATATRMLLDGSVRSPAKQAVLQDVASPVRFIEWPGWGTIDLETYNRNCNCGMCSSIRSMQQEYWKQKNAFQQSQTQVTPDKEGCPHDLVENLLDAMQLRASDVLGDLGCGDGRILIAAARRGIRGIGVEIDPDRAEIARRNVRSAGYERLVTIETGDVLEFHMNRVTCATTYLYPPLLAKLSPMLKSLRVVASPYHEVPGLAMTQVGDVWTYRR